MNKTQLKLESLRLAIALHAPSGDRNIDSIVKTASKFHDRLVADQKHLGITSVQELKVEPQTINALLGAGISTVEELVGLPSDQIQNIPNIGSKRMQTLRSELVARGFAQN